jgi:integrase
MKRVLGKLSAARVAKLAKRGRYSDGGGLWLQISKWDTRAWVFRWERDGRERMMGLGATGTLTLANARERARRCRLMVLDGVDPIEQRTAERSQRRVEAAKSATFQECAEQYIASHRAGWRNAKHAEQWASTLRRFAFPVFGNMPVNAIDTTLVMRVLEPIWREMPETGSRVRGRIESVLDWARVRAFCAGDNPARWRGHLSKLFPSRRKVRATRHHPSLAYGEVPGFMAQLRERQGTAARALEFLILTGARTSEALGATWAEVDTEARLWTVPANRTKAGREHRVPLSAGAMRALSAPGRSEAPLFAIGRTAILEIMRAMRPGYVPHGFRSSFRDWAAERTNFPREVCEAALGHAVGDAVERAYRRGDLFEKRRKLMDAWATFCAKAGSDSAVVAFEHWSAR